MVRIVIKRLSGIDMILPWFGELAETITDPSNRIRLIFIKTLRNGHQYYKEERL